MNVQPKKLLLMLYFALSIYCIASLVHFVHNATYLHDYPNLPRSLSAARVYAAWRVVTAVGILGLWLYRRHQLTGLAVLAVYAVLGFGGLDHYTLAPLTAHSIMMNLTIAFEVLAAGVLLVIVAVCYTDVVHGRKVTAQSLL